MPERRARRVVAGLALLSASWPVIAADASIDDASWLTGCWSGGEGDTRSEEHWMAPDGGTMIGMNRTVRGNETVAYELVRIVETGAESLAYIASPSGQATTRFDLVRAGDDELVFENLAHDFPQRILYRRLDRDRIVARIEDESGARAVDFPLHRKRCDPADA